jgi:hypothetical protein
LKFLFIGILIWEYGSKNYLMSPLSRDETGRSSKGETADSGILGFQGFYAAFSDSKDSKDSMRFHEIPKIP